MKNFIFLMFYDIKESLLSSDIMAMDFARITFFILWLCIIIYPITGIDRRDISSFLGYLIYGLATGILFVIVLPHKYVPEDTGLGIAFILLLIIFISTVRWQHKFKEASMAAEKSLTKDIKNLDKRNRRS